VLLLDTHAWIWTVEGDVRRIGRRARRLISQFESDQALRVSPLTLFEIVALHVAGRLRLSLLPEQWIRESLANPGVRVAELSAAVAVDAGHIPRASLADPVDRLLVATARQLDATLLTADRAILEYARQSRSVRVRDASV
jgi:PIN domain nuclease of toxin-antitoxin system